MRFFILIFFLLLGLIVGSFLNVCIYRIPINESIVKPSSKCPKCKKPLKPWDNIPLLSYLVLGGKCRYCREPISLKYPLVEFITGVLFALAFLKFDLSLSLVLGIFLISVLVVLTFIDLSYLIIPNKIIYPSLVIALALVAINFFTVPFLPLVGAKNPLFSICGFLGGGGFLFLVAILGEKIFKQEVMGGGDIKLAALLGIFLGWYVWLALFLGFLFGSIVGVTLMLLKQKGRKDFVPFGPFLALGGILTLFFGPQIYNLYASLWMIG
ncbi:prepilin peptidase [Candidatus Oleimmundimicrobium sp.]|uniref:prepilin peptidase n=1 Tax=Candidatus Oleimmundimicrobium sp. TaxID=3060597 RepID=UPI002716F90F|nr:prepilin peptidase [Candidatus Oleimmundimicrobium sp.]MDO8886493.1 prepilin peptidase [Candidatus Oleimmundimicrobium sp.]